MSRTVAYGRPAKVRAVVRPLNQLAYLVLALKARGLLSPLPGWLIMPVRGWTQEAYLAAVLDG